VVGKVNGEEEELDVSDKSLLKHLAVCICLGSWGAYVYRVGSQPNKVEIVVHSGKSSTKPLIKRIILVGLCKLSDEAHEEDVYNKNQKRISFNAIGDG